MPFQNLFSDNVPVEYVACCCIGYHMACTVTGPHYPGFLPMGIFERMRIEEQPTHNAVAEACYLGRNCDHKSRAVAPSFDSFVNRLR
jgi:hypothetical protein